MKAIQEMILIMVLSALYSSSRAVEVPSVTNTTHILEITAMFDSGVQYTTDTLVRLTTIADPAIDIIYCPNNHRPIHMQAQKDAKKTGDADNLQRWNLLLEPNKETVTNLVSGARIACYALGGSYNTDTFVFLLGRIPLNEEVKSFVPTTMTGLLQDLLESFKIVPIITTFSAFSCIFMILVPLFVFVFNKNRRLKHD